MTQAMHLAIVYIAQQATAILVIGSTQLEGSPHMPEHNPWNWMTSTFLSSFVFHTTLKNCCNCQMSAAAHKPQPKR